MFRDYEGRVAPIRVDPGPRLLEELDTTPVARPVQSRPGRCRGGRRRAALIGALSVIALLTASHPGAGGPVVYQSDPAAADRAADRRDAPGLPRQWSRRRRGPSPTRRVASRTGRRPRPDRPPDDRASPDPSPAHRPTAGRPPSTPPGADTTEPAPATSSPPPPPPATRSATWADDRRPAAGRRGAGLGQLPCHRVARPQPPDRQLHVRHQDRHGAHPLHRQPARRPADDRELPLARLPLRHQGRPARPRLGVPPQLHQHEHQQGPGRPPDHGRSLRPGLSTSRSRSASPRCGACGGFVRGKYIETIAGLGACVGLMLIALLIVHDPAGTVGKVGNWGDAAGREVASGVAGAVQPGNRAQAQEDGLDRGAQAIFDTIVLRPWCALQFGDVNFCRASRRRTRSTTTAPASSGTTPPRRPQSPTFGCGFPRTARSATSSTRRGRTTGTPRPSRGSR